MRRLRLVMVVAVAAAVIGAGALWRGRGRQHDVSVSAPPADVRAPDGVRVRVEVLNGTRTRGLARRATFVLRDRGFDVVANGTESAARDTTVVYDLTGHPDWAQRVARVFAPARVESRPDSSRYLDVSVVLGATWRPPAEPFHP